MKIVTWNINSVRLRLPLLKQLIQEEGPDIICLQETKAQDIHFPEEIIRSFGYDHVLFRGNKGYNGVAILSKIPIQLSQKLEIAASPDARHIAAILPQGIELHNFYVPAGGDEPDISINPKYQFKLNFVDDMTRWFLTNRKTNNPMILLGDLNIAPLEQDVWSHKQLLNVVSHTPAETTRMEKLYQSMQWVDVSRHFVPASQKLYSWWSYRNRDWRKSDRGRRLDHIWVTPALKSQLVNHSILKQARDWRQPSDHVPVLVVLK